MCETLGITSTKSYRVRPSVEPPSSHHTSLVDSQIAKRSLVLDTFRDCTSRQVDMMRGSKDEDTFAKRGEQGQNMQKGDECTKKGMRKGFLTNRVGHSLGVFPILTNPQG